MDVDKKYVYRSRQSVAFKRLRIQGRFVTKSQAYEILGITKDELMSNELIQQLLTNLAEQNIKVNTNVECKNDLSQIIKVRNFEALVNENYCLKSTFTDVTNPSDMKSQNS
jgi:hypothetical protein